MAYVLCALVASSRLAMFIVESNFCAEKDPLNILEKINVFERLYMHNPGTPR